MDTYSLENGVKISEQQKEARLICQLGTYIFWLILRKAWLQSLANDWKNICFHKYPDKCGRGVKTILVPSLAVQCPPLSFLDAKKQTVFGLGLLSTPNPRQTSRLFLSGESRVGGSESAFGSPSLSQGLKSP